MAALNPLAPAQQWFPQRVPLPPNPFNQGRETSFYEAYECCLQDENRAGNDARLLMYSRCLGYLILEAPSPEARHIIANEIIDCVDQQSDLDGLAEFYISHVFRLCMLSSTNFHPFLHFLASSE